MFIEMFETSTAGRLVAIRRKNCDFNEWDSVHNNQGFCWREGSAEFILLSDVISFEVCIRIEDKIIINEKASRIISVPFEVTEEETYFWNMWQCWPLNLEKGKYDLVYSGIPEEKNNGTERCEIMFVKNSNPVPKIIKADDQLKPSLPLKMTAKGISEGNYHD